ncbi:receptor-like cytosolic serine/threonine-protein kinase RBK2 [Argentina anserina]|uniref:receptor-like cytosolic serine/threonine-protein kinase RBK2 n=1 Tax=Argentina anserina TaxID=57926 RepID=UPI0021762DE0|nr:receptor-like cytosolic serine/threonine-protein kinase RBK2 [Potentilla anserina]
MANGEAQGPYCPWMPGDNDEKIEVNNPNPNEVSVVIPKRRDCLRHSVSAQDLRYRDIEKEKYDGQSPRGVLEACMESFEEASISENNKPELEAPCPDSKPDSHWRKFFKLWKKRSIKQHLPSFPLVPKMSLRKRSNSTKDDSVLNNIYNFKSPLKSFSFSALQTATNNFSNENIIGKGGYSEVYRGTLKDGQLVAIKRLTNGTSDEKTAGFLSELGIIAHVDHPNTAKLVGCCVEKGMHLVFQLSSLGSLGSLLHGPKNDILDWSKRYKIALGAADGLMYLHDSCQRRIIHRDIKADNILLTEDFVPQICDFGLAKWLPKQWTHHNVSKFEGTFGYFAPEYFMHGIVDEKTDVYSFGVLLLELITGRPALDHLQQSLVIWAKPLLNGNDVKELVDPSIRGNYDSTEMDHMILTASLCTDPSSILRPRMSQVVVLLRGDEYVSKCAKETKRRSLLRTYSEELMDAQEYNSTKYLRDLNRHKQIAFEA